jgi:hypothetical protein
MLTEGGGRQFDFIRRGLHCLGAVINALPIKTEIEHVKGHQDRHKPWEELDARVQINVLADRQADANFQEAPWTNWSPSYVHRT